MHVLRTLATGVLLAAAAHAQFESYDRLMSDLMERYHLPGGAVAVTRNGKLVFAQGYGFADRDRRVRVQSDSLFRIASISKPFTSAAILKLAEAGKLRLDDKAFPYLKDLQPPQGATPDPRLASITIRQLLHHTGGWDRDASFDPMFRPVVAAKSVGTAAPASCETVIRYMLGQKLDFDPGTKYAYSNFGFCILGRIIERVSGMRYEEFVKREVLAPAGITRMKVGKSLTSDTGAGEVHYYHDGEARSVFPSITGQVPWSYGGFYLEAMDSHGGWIASAIDLVKFANAIDGRRGKPLLRKESIAELISRPAPPMPQNAESWYGLGWSIRRVGNDANWWHTGSLPGTTTILVRAANGYCWAALFNSRPEGKNTLAGDLDSGLWTAFRGVTDWPSRDLF
jgi:N-acyl-D-amino-acid deacylase